MICWIFCNDCSRSLNLCIALMRLCPELRSCIGLGLGYSSCGRLVCLVLFCSLGSLSVATSRIFLRCWVSRLRCSELVLDFLSLSKLVVLFWSRWWILFCVRIMTFVRSGLVRVFMIYWICHCTLFSSLREIYLSAETELWTFLAEEETGLDVVVLWGGGVDVGVEYFWFGASADAWGGCSSDFGGYIIEGVASMCMVMYRA